MLHNEQQQRVALLAGKGFRRRVASCTVFVQCTHTTITVSWLTLMIALIFARLQAT